MPQLIGWPTTALSLSPVRSSVDWADFKYFLHHPSSSMFPVSCVYQRYCYGHLILSNWGQGTTIPLMSLVPVLLRAKSVLVPFAPLNVPMSISGRDSNIVPHNCIWRSRNQGYTSRPKVGCASLCARGRVYELNEEGNRGRVTFFCTETHERALPSSSSSLASYSLLIIITAKVKAPAHLHYSIFPRTLSKLR